MEVGCVSRLGRNQPCRLLPVVVAFLFSCSFAHPLYQNLERTFSIHQEGQPATMWEGTTAVVTTGSMSIDSKGK
ncbi:hypothetical protein V8E55_008365 [Tylopilus felleus]